VTDVAAALREPPISLDLANDELVHLLLLAAQSDVRANPSQVFVSFKEVMDITDTTGRSDAFLIASIKNKIYSSPIEGDAYKVLGLTQVLRQRHWSHAGSNIDSCSEHELGQLLQSISLVLTRDELHLVAGKAHCPGDGSALGVRDVSIGAAMTYLAGLVR